MEVIRPSDARAFLELAGPLLRRDEPRNQLALGIAGTIVEHPQAYDQPRFWVTVEGGDAVAAGLRTPPYALVLADPGSDGALTALLDAVARDDPLVPGLTANAPHVHPAARALAEATGREAEPVLSLGVFALRQVREVAEVPGRARDAGRADLDLLRSWITDFLNESVPEPERDLARLDRTLGVRLSSPGAGFWLWEGDAGPVSLAGYGGRTPSGIRIGPVYTPPEHRRRGYATALVAALSAWLLERGHRACFLYTDLSNPTSNRIYGDIGYERVGDSMEYRFRERGAPVARP
jgi:hypothetical protein